MLIVLLELYENEIDDRVGENSNDKSDDRVEDGILSARDRTTITITGRVADTTDDDHNNGDGTKDVEQNINDGFDTRTQVGRLFGPAGLVNPTLYLIGWCSTDVAWHECHDTEKGCN